MGISARYDQKIQGGAVSEGVRCQKTSPESHSDRELVALYAEGKCISEIAQALAVSIRDSPEQTE
jgi:DNA-binding CsgD family transcriptional regulator